jgi:hypothetical protein
MTVQLNIDAILRAIGSAAPQAPGVDFASLMTVSTQIIAPALQIADADGTRPTEPLTPSPDVSGLTANPKPDAPVPSFRIPDSDGQKCVPVEALVFAVESQPASDTIGLAPTPNFVPEPKVMLPIAAPAVKSPRAKIDQPDVAKDQHEPAAENPLADTRVPKASDVLPDTDPLALISTQLPEKAGLPALAIPGQPMMASTETTALRLERDFAVAETNTTAPVRLLKPGVHVPLYMQAADRAVAQSIAPDKSVPPALPATEIRIVTPVPEQRQSFEQGAGNLPPFTTDNPARILAPMARSDMGGDAGSAPMPDRGSSLLSAQVMALARDIVTMGAERDVRFNLRPEMLGPVAVTIERRDDGPMLRLGVETPAAVQAMRQAEPALTEAAARTGSPFVQVSVDLQSPGQRDRPARAAPLIKRGRDVVLLAPIEPAVVTSGRFA